MGAAFTSLPFTGRDRLLAAIDGAVCLADPPLITHALQKVLREAIIDPLIELPACVRRPVDGHYARRELHRSPTLGYSVIAMCWGPGQGTPLHDHDAMWCVEGVWQGELIVTPYALLERQGERHRFAAQEALYGYRGSAGSLIPPHEYHTLRNASDTDVAVSVHVYQGVMERSAVFDPLDDGWYQRRVKMMETDAA
ncbi:cysteine dioxygenase family protein [Stenotrophomonas sp. ZAC14A_NAIMI4_1]|uniref:cysteine dioxygenase family protein n=1 Tax=Stenotrophomonas sp. ZAC14A_NAIMI4_1 TaxID=2072412 RepID=UPI000D53FBF8|nr:cysteine dioxygenase family protein [Stenotrophomonas sp. ZAC14A_NAIMI4_1]AWH43546.1 cysteine dioxygenase [Stenotrophomonas sp. ZAC14A_NAIMI4_1]